MSRVLAYLALLAVVVGFVNFFWFMAESGSLGGDAGNGYRRGSDCFVGSHGAYRPVDCQTWERNRVHGQTVFATHPLGMLGGAYLLFRFVFPSAMGRRPSAASTARQEALRGSGPELASGSPGGRVGNLNMTRGMLGVAVFPAGILLEPRFMAPAAILASEITGLGVAKGMLRSRYARIDHRATEVASPVVLYVAPDSDLARAIERVAGRAFGSDAAA
jgi:hypothetical protein